MTQPETVGFYISEATAGAVFLIWCAAIVLICTGLAS